MPDNNFVVTGLNKKDYFISFEEIVLEGFLCKLSWSAKDSIKESRIAKISYPSPVKFGYDLLLQQAFISYDREIIAAYKLEKNNFGSKLKITDYKRVVDVPLNRKLIHTLKNMEDLVQIINHLEIINISSSKVEIFDLVNNDKFYNKDYEQLKLSFIPQKQYVNLEDLLNNILQYYTVDYIVAMNPLEATVRHLPVSLFYEFSALPSGRDMIASAVIKTAGNTIEKITRGLQVKADIVCDSSFLSMSNFKLDYRLSSDNIADRGYDLDITSKLHFKQGMFEELFKRYEFTALQVISSPTKQLIDREIQYIICNKDKFKFKNLENSDYAFNLKMNFSHSKGKLYMEST